jgi:hypothetical protein
MVDACGAASTSLADKSKASEAASTVRLADEYLARHPHRGEIRHDVLSLFWNGRRFIVRHFRDAFRPVSDPYRPWRWTA